MGRAESFHTPPHDNQEKWVLHFNRSYQEAWILEGNRATSHDFWKLKQANNNEVESSYDEASYGLSRALVYVSQGANKPRQAQGETMYNSSEDKKHIDGRNANTEEIEKKTEWRNSNIPLIAGIGAFVLLALMAVLVRLLG